ncbi:hypothetical protein RRG08_063727 [Elysia crispata]|uniref:DDE-1 domain-containing protein n=1 Tax=Elysia crispata TaxID=231223 RepID=A0AAE0ZV32_9GAST|nr:hypothetical protein RRG08_063727 [Elysia crispata]
MVHPQAVFEVQDKGWMDTTLFKKWLEHFIQRVKPSPDDFNTDTPPRCVQKEPINGESIGTDNEDELPLARLKKSKAIDNAKSSGFIDPDSDYDVYLQDSDSDPEFNPGICEVRHCKDPVWSACEECDILVCYDHFMEEVNTCGQHGKKNKNDKKKDKGKENTLVKNQVARQETTKKGVHHEEENNTSRGRQGGEEGDTTEIETGEGGL